jgi:uncharacterized protein YfaQ (DUF2300 family)
MSSDQIDMMLTAVDQQLKALEIPMQAAADKHLASHQADLNSQQMQQQAALQPPEQTPQAPGGIQ